MCFLAIPKEIISIGKFSITWYAVIILSGAIIATLIGYFRFGKRLGIPSDYIYEGLALGLVCGIIGARLYYWAFEADNMTFLEMLGFGSNGFAGLAIHGGIIATAIFLPIYCKLRNIKLLYLLEIAMPLILFAQVVGRWGNFINQEAYGTLVKFIGIDNLDIVNNTIRLTNSQLLEQQAALQKLWIPNFIIEQMKISNGFFLIGTERITVIGEAYFYPTFLFESLANLVGIVAYWVCRKHIKKLYVGDGLSFYLIWYGIVRFFIEILRTDPLTFSIFGWTIKVAQLTSIIYIIIGLAFFIIRRVKKFQLVSCYDALYGDDSTIMKEEYFNKKVKEKTE